MSSSWQGLLAIHQVLTPLHARPHLSGCRRQRPLMKCGKHNSVFCTKSGNRIILGTSIKTRLWLIVSVCKCSDHRSIKIPALLETQSPLIFTSRPFDTITASQHHSITASQHHSITASWHPYSLSQITLLTISKQQKSIALLQIQIRKSSFESPPEEQGNQDSSVHLLKASLKIT
jgi:hypothetical protein